jgi:hypothetical protein
LATDSVDDIDGCLDIALWSAAAAMPMLPMSTMEAASGKRGNFMADFLNEAPPLKTHCWKISFVKECSLRDTR